MMAIYGSNVGSTFARMALSSTLKGAVRQLTACQDLFKIAGAVLFVPLLYVEVFGRVPLVYALARHVSTSVDRQMAFVFLLFNLTMAILFTVLQPLIGRLLEWATPADGQADYSKVQYLYDEALDATADRAVLQVTSVFERVIWITHRFARLIEPAPAEGATASRDAIGEPSMTIGEA